VSHEYLARDVAWGEGTTYLGRTADGEGVDGEVVKDLSTLQTVGLSVGDAPTAADVEALLVRTAKERGAFGGVLGSDHFSAHLKYAGDTDTLTQFCSSAWRICFGTCAT
jgi:hypothetical protein